MSKFHNKAHRINNQISAKKVFLITDDGTKTGVVYIEEALSLARSKNMDLVEVAKESFPPVCKIMDYGKYCFVMKKNQSKSNKEAKAKSKKELQVRPNIAEHDFQVKVKHLMEFLEDGCRVNIILKFKGRQIVHPEIGLALLNRFAEAAKELAKIETEPVIEGKRASMLLAPLGARGKVHTDKETEPVIEK